MIDDLKFRVVAIGEMFSIWADDKAHTLIKISPTEAMDLHYGEIEKIHPNKSCSRPRTVDAQSVLADVKGEIVLVKPFSKDRALIQHVLVLGAEVIDKVDIKFLDPENSQVRFVNLVHAIKKNITNSSTLLDALEIMGGE